MHGLKHVSQETVHLPTHAEEIKDCLLPVLGHGTLLLRRNITLSDGYFTTYTGWCKGI
jgi:hypothetical protein